MGHHVAPAKAELDAPAEHLEAFSIVCLVRSISCSFPLEREAKGRTACRSRRWG
jgi:hypothetical protein